MKRVTRKEEIGRVYEILVENNIEKRLEGFVLHGRII
jgi:phosphoketolase